MARRRCVDSEGDRDPAKRPRQGIFHTCKYSDRDSSLIHFVRGDNVLGEALNGNDFLLGANGIYKIAYGLRGSWEKRRFLDSLKGLSFG